MFSEPAVLRVTAAVAAATAAVGAAVMRRWDVEAGKRVADLTRARASDEWRHEEKVAELETDLDESRELRTKLEHKLRAKRTELANLRNEHAALLRRYATAETERASALEGRRLLEIETTAPEDARALPAAGADAGDGDGDGGTTAASRTSTVPPQGTPAPGAPWASWETASKAAAERAAAQDGKGAKGGAGAGADSGAGAGAGASAGRAEAEEEGSGEEKSAPAVFSPAGSSLFLRANSALDRIITQRGSVKGEEDAGAAEAEAEAAAESVVAGDVDEFTDERAGEGVGEAADESLDGAVDDSVDGPEDGTVGEQNSETVETSAETSQSTEPTQATAAPGPATESAESAASAESADGTVSGEGAKGGSPKGPSPKGDPDGPTDGGTRQGRSAEAEEEPVPVLTAEEGDAVGKSAATRGHERAAGGPVPVVAAPAGSTGVGELTRVEPSGRVEPVVPSVGHFTVPTAVAVVPAAPRRRTAVEGGFDFFGMQKSAEALEAVQNEDLADVVGQEALALHKAESEAQFKRADEASRGIGQVIDLTAHDETEQIDVQGLRTAAS
ncbi:hypothetical protein [Streptomyces sp. 11x1]|uniref:hypothetical protein n=1 Tax=Streptomyces sp. 11x1 TaxID=3038642 RepID=UPI00292F3D36|nr:hypothetical protein [Streptomyces sp. 11x1]WNZ09505.1 hypothetical protein P8T65_19220 [Streptomyces sp. 11x1]